MSPTNDKKKRDEDALIKRDKLYFLCHAVQQAVLDNALEQLQQQNERRAFELGHLFTWFMTQVVATSPQYQINTIASHLDPERPSRHDIDDAIAFLEPLYYGDKATHSSFENDLKAVCESMRIKQAHDDFYLALRGLRHTFDGPSEFVTNTCPDSRDHKTSDHLIKLDQLFNERMTTQARAAQIADYIKQHNLHRKKLGWATSADRSLVMMCNRFLAAIEGQTFHIDRIAPQQQALLNRLLAEPSLSESPKHWLAMLTAVPQASWKDVRLKDGDLRQLNLLISDMPQENRRRRLANFERMLKHYANNVKRFKSGKTSRDIFIFSKSGSRRNAVEAMRKILNSNESDEDKLAALEKYIKTHSHLIGDSRLYAMCHECLASTNLVAKETATLINLRESQYQAVLEQCHAALQTDGDPKAVFTVEKVALLSSYLSFDDFHTLMMDLVKKVQPIHMEQVLLEAVFTGYITYFNKASSNSDEQKRIQDCAIEFCLQEHRATVDFTTLVDDKATSSTQVTSEMFKCRSAESAVLSDAQLVAIAVMLQKMEPEVFRGLLPTMRKRRPSVEANPDWPKMDQLVHTHPVVSAPA